MKSGYGNGTRSGKRNFVWRARIGSDRALRQGARKGLGAALALGLSLVGASASWGAEGKGAHGLAMHGAPALAEGFESLPYAAPQAPQGGRITLGEMGGYDSLNPYILKGRAPWSVRRLSVESLLGRNWDEPFALYGLLAETVTTPEDRSWAAFTLRAGARFSDGSPVTVADVVWSMQVLAEKGRPGFRNVWENVESWEKTGPRTVRFEFAEPDREAPLILGLRPILKKARFDGRDFAQSTLEPLVGSGPYVVADMEPGRSLTWRRDPDYWGADLPFNAGRWNFAEIRYEWFKDDAARFEAFRAGALDVFRETDPARWAEGYDFPAVREGEIVRAEIPHGRPTGMTGFVFNTRRALFADRRVRLALAHAFDFEWTNRVLNRGAYARIRSLFGNSPLAFEGAAAGREREILAPFADALPEGALEGFRWPRTDGSGRNRRNLRTAVRLLQEAGWEVREGRLMKDGRPFAFEILLGGPAWEAAAQTFARMLEPLGIEARVRLVDGAQYEARRADYDFDMIVNRWASSLSPGAEQKLYWDGRGVETPGTRNYPGVDSPAAEAAIAALLTAESRGGFEAAARALDRVLTTGVYFVPLWHAPASRIAYRAELGFPDDPPLYGDWVGWLPDVWWRKE